METTPAPQETPELTQRDIVRAATNDPALSERDFILGDRLFTIVDLEYDDYLTFMLMLEPVLTMTLGAIQNARARNELSLADGLSLKGIIKFCGKDLPEMVRIICAQTDPTVTAQDVKDLGKSPFTLAKIVMLQVEQNGMIKQIADFFAQALPALTVAAKAMRLTR